MKELLKKIITEIAYLPKARKYKKISKKYNIAGKYKRIYHYHIRKTGGTSLNHIFLGQGNDSSNQIYSQLCNNFPTHCTCSGDRVFVGWNKRLIEKGDYFYAYSHLPSHELSLPQDTFTVTVLRDPIKRVISHYKMLLEDKVNKTNQYIKLESKWLGSSFTEFLDKIPKEHLLNQLYMFSKNLNVDEAYEKITNCSHYFLTDEYTEGVKQLSKKLNLDLKTKHSRKSKIKPEIVEDDLQRLREMLAPEIKLYEKLKNSLR